MSVTEKRFQRGLLPFDPAKHARFKTAAKYGFSWPTPTYPIDKSGGVTSFGMGGNGPDPTLTVNGGNPVGDCGPNAVPKNVNLTTAALLGLPPVGFTSNQIVRIYFTYQAEQAGISWRPPTVGTEWTPPAGLDVGVTLGDWLLWLFKNGYIEGFVALELAETDAALALADAVVAGVNLNPQADTQAESGNAWDVGPGDESDPTDGHAIELLSVAALGGPTTWATWGMTVRATPRWRAACVQQAFAVLTRAQAEKVGFPFDTLLDDLRAAGGTVIADPTPPAVGAGRSPLAEAVVHVRADLSEAEQEVVRFCEATEARIRTVWETALGSASQAARSANELSGAYADVGLAPVTHEDRERAFESSPRVVTIRGPLTTVVNVRGFSSDVGPLPAVAVDGPVPAIPLPSWTTSTAITSYLVTLGAFVVSLLTMLHVVVPSDVSSNITTWAGIAGVAIAAGVQIANWVRVSVLHKAAIAAGVPIKEKGVVLTTY